MSKLSVTINTNKLVLQLEAIAKHAKTLSEALENIESNKCDECGGDLLTINESKEYTTKECKDCKELHAYPED